MAASPVIEQPNNALQPSLDPARLALPLHAVCLKCVLA